MAASGFFNDPGVILTYFLFLLSSAPLLIVWIIGLILCFIYWNQEPRVARWSAVVFGGLLLYALVDRGIRLIIPRFLSLKEIEIVYPIWGGIGLLLETFIWSIVIFLLFRRKTKPTAS